jgi:ribonuclease HI
MTAAHYASIRNELCFSGNTIHLDIALEIGAEIVHNNPLRPDAAQRCMHTDAHKLQAWTDGSADETTKTVGYGVYWGRAHPLNYTRRTIFETNTNNTAELTAVLHVVSALPRSADVVIYTDSQVTIQVVKTLKKNLANPQALHSLTRKDSVATARVKRALFAVLVERRDRGASTELHHVYSHLLDGDGKMDNKERNKKMTEMMGTYGAQHVMQILRGNKCADELASDSKHLRAHVMPPTSIHDPTFVIHEEDIRTQSKQRIGENTRRYVYKVREQQARAKHIHSQNSRFVHNPETTANDHACDSHSLTDEKLTLGVADEVLADGCQAARQVEFPLSSAPRRTDRERQSV